MKMINILITSCGRRVELVQAFKAARDKLNISGNVVCADCLFSAPALSFGDKKYVIPRIDSGKYIQVLKEIIVNENINLVVPTIDTELQIFADNKAELESSGAKVLIASKEAVAICGDKNITAKFFYDNGFDLPATIAENEWSSYAGEYPLFIKPRNGSSSINVFKVNNKKELDFFIDYVQNPIVQQCVTGQEYTIDILTDFDGKPILVVPRKRLAVRSGEILKGQIDKNKKIIEISKMLVKKLSFSGMLTVQGFWTSDEKLLLIEMNARFGGGAPMSIKAGADFCEMLYRMLSGEILSYNENYNDGTLVVRFDDSVVIYD